MTKPLVFVMGTRPEKIKLLPILKELRDCYKRDYYVIYTGQHSQKELIETLLPERYRVYFSRGDMSIGGCHPPIRQGHFYYPRVTEIMKCIGSALENIENWREPGLVVAIGDTDTVLAAALATVKSYWVFAQLEGGLRSFYMYQPEEMNRIIIDRIANVVFAPSPYSILNLLDEGVTPQRILRGIALSWGSVCTLLLEGDLEKEITENRSGILTIHRAENADDKDTLCRILNAVSQAAKDHSLTLHWPQHYRPKMTLAGSANSCGDYSVIRIINPLRYDEILRQLMSTSIVLTDSGGIQLESVLLAKPLYILRNVTEWVELLECCDNTVRIAGENIYSRDTLERDIKSFLNKVLRDKQEYYRTHINKCLRCLLRKYTWARKDELDNVLCGCNDISNYEDYIACIKSICKKLIKNKIRNIVDSLLKIVDNQEVYNTFTYNKSRMEPRFNPSRPYYTPILKPYTNAPQNCNRIYAGLDSTKFKLCIMYRKSVDSNDIEVDCGYATATYCVAREWTKSLEYTQK